jgi:hypothetical protein
VQGVFGSQLEGVVLEKTYEIVQKNEIVGPHPVDQRIVHHYAEGQDEEHAHAQKAGAEEAEAPQKIFSFFSSFGAKIVHITFPVSQYLIV